MASSYILVTVLMNLLLSLSGTIGNGVLIIAFMYQRNIRTVQNYFNFATFVSGLFVSAVCYPLQGLMNSFVIKTNPGCIIVFSFISSCGLFLTLNCLALTVERYISICHPLKALTLLSPRRVGVALGAVQLYAITIGVFIPLATPIGHKGTYNESLLCRLHVLVPKSYGTFMMLNFLSPIPAMLIIYSRIFFVLRRHIRAISMLPAQGIDAPISSSDHNRWNRKVWSAIFLLILIISFVVCWLPWAIMILGKTYTHKINPVTFSIFNSLPYVTSTINPYLYGVGNKAFRLAVIDTFQNMKMSCLKPEN